MKRIGPGAGFIHGGLKTMSPAQESGVKSLAPGGLAPDC